MVKTDLLDGVELGVVEVAQEPQHPRPQHLAQQQDEGGEVEHVHHAHQPVDEHRRPGGLVKTALPVLEGGVEHRLKHNTRQRELSNQLQYDLYRKYSKPQACMLLQMCFNFFNMNG